MNLRAVAVIHEPGTEQTNGKLSIIFIFNLRERILKQKYYKIEQSDNFLY